MRASSYLLTMAGTMVVLAVVTVVFTIFADPYRMFGTPTMRGLTELKPRAFEKLSIAKTYQLERIAPKTLLLGNSRTEIGLDPMSGQFPATQRAVFNAAYAGRDVCTSVLMLRDAMAVRIPDKIILGVDFQDYLTVPKALSETVPKASRGLRDDEQRLLVDNNGRPNAQRKWQVWKDRIAATLTIDALLDSVITLLNQNPATGATMTDLGFNPLHEYRIFAARSGYYEMFSQKNAAYRKQYSTFAKPDFAQPSLPLIRTDQCFLTLAKMAVEHRIPLTLYIHPYHASFLDMLSQFDLWTGFEDWKRHLVAQVADLQTDQHEIRIIDFSGYNEFTTEAIPSPGDTKSEMRWYWEPGHYKSALGEHILERIIHGRTYFGRILTPANVESILAEIREERDQFSRLRDLQHREAAPKAFSSWK